MRTISAGLGTPAPVEQAQDVIGKLGNNEGIRELQPGPRRCYSN